MATVARSLGPVPGATWTDDGYAVVPAALDRTLCAALADGAAAGSVEHRDPTVTRLGVDLVGRLTGDRVEAATGRIVVTLPGVAGRGWGRQRAGTVALHLALRPATLAGGCPWVVPGSHRADGVRPRDSLPPVTGTVPVQLDTGDLVLLDDGLVHRVTDNHSVDPAASLVVVFRRRGG